MSTLTERLEQIRTRMASAAVRSGRTADAVELVAVSKTQPPEALREVFASGQTLFGENRVQEILAKQPLLPSMLRWHLIGPLQSNKVRKVLPRVEMIDLTPRRGHDAPRMGAVRRRDQHRVPHRPGEQPARG